MVSAARFETGKFGILFFSRGRGRGHAVPDSAIAKELLRVAPNVQVIFVSYSLGAETLRLHGHEVVDLELQRDPHFIDTLILEGHLIASLRPRLVIAHEEFAAVPAAHLSRIPCLFLTDFFSDPMMVTTYSLRYAEEVIFIGPSGLFTEPPYLRGKVSYVGPAVRRFSYSSSDRFRARSELGLMENAFVVSCLPGSWQEVQVPITEMVVTAWEMVSLRPKMLLWVAGMDYEKLRLRVGHQPDIVVLKEDWMIDRLIVASDLVITKGTRNVVYEVASLGVPSLTLSVGINWPDDVGISHVKSNVVLDATTLSAAALAESLMAMIKNGVDRGSPPRWDGVCQAARRLLHHVQSLQGQQ